MAEPRNVGQGIALLQSLRAVRQFRPAPVPAQVIADILDIARWSGSAKNSQPWEFIVIRNRATLTALAVQDGYVNHLAGAQLAIVLVMAGENEEAETYDEGRLSERIGLAAAAHGLGQASAGSPALDARRPSRHAVPLTEKTVPATVLDW